jgi:hypothetical protein
LLTGSKNATHPSDTHVDSSNYRVHRRDVFILAAFVAIARRPSGHDSPMATRWKDLSASRQEQALSLAMVSAASSMFSAAVIGDVPLIGDARLF